VYGIVKQSRGLIKVDTKLGSGTSFKVHFPATELCEAVLEADQNAAHVHSHGGTVLVVEDAPSFRSLICEVLQAHEYKVLVAKDGTEALRICEEYKGPIHLLLTDVIMPGISGPTLAKRVRARRGETRCLLMSGHSGELIESDKLSPYMSFIQKPFAPADLLHRISDLLADGKIAHRQPERAQGASA
jgi:DNA-binding response OmpR family regulator